MNAWLFSEAGKKHLQALVAYHAVVNETLYSDAYYRGTGGHDSGGDDDGGDGDGDGKVVEGKGRGKGYWHVDMPTLLHGVPVSVDVRQWRGWVSIVVKGFVRVMVRDGVADDGVIHAVNRVLIPPCRRHGPHRPGGRVDDEDRDIDVEELKGRLEPYMEGSSEREDVGDL